MRSALKRILFTRASTTIENPTLSWRCYSSPASPSPPPNSKLFVGGPLSLLLSLCLLCLCHFYIDGSDVVMCLAGLSWSVDEKSLKDAFTSFGEVTEGKEIRV